MRGLDWISLEYAAFNFILIKVHCTYASLLRRVRFIAFSSSENLDLHDLRKVQRKVLITSGGLARAAVLSIIKKLYVSVIKII